MFGLSWWHLLLVLVVFVLLFGAGRISGLMADTAKGLRSFKKGLADDDDEHAETKLVAQKREPAGASARNAGSKAARRSRA